MSVALAVVRPPIDRKALRGEILGLLAGGSAECATLAARLGQPFRVVFEELEFLGALDLVDALDPPEPCGREHLRWFLYGHPLRWRP